MSTLAVPIHASHESLLRVRMLASMKVRMAATAVKTALQVPCSDTALRAIEVLIIPEPPTMIHAGEHQYGIDSELKGHLPKMKAT